MIVPFGSSTDRVACAPSLLVNQFLVFLVIYPLMPESALPPSRIILIESASRRFLKEKFDPVLTLIHNMIRMILTLE